MKNYIHLFFITLHICLFGVLNGQAQANGKIYTKTGSVIVAKIVDITVDEITYKAPWTRKQPIFKLPRTEVNRLTVTDFWGVAYDISDEKAEKRIPKSETDSTDKVYNYVGKQAVDNLIDSIRIKKRLRYNVQAFVPEQRNIGLSFNLGGPSLIASWNLDFFLSRHLSLEFGSAYPIYRSFYTGAKIHFPLKSRATNYASIYVGGLFGKGALGKELGNYSALYFPVGLHTTSKKGFIFSLETAWVRPLDSYVDNRYYYRRSLDKSILWAQLRLGKRFLKLGKKTIKS